MINDNASSHRHPLVFADQFHSLVDFGIFLMHKRDYEEAAQLTRGASVLDLGCNNGYGSRILAGVCRDVTAVDVSEGAIVDAIERFGDLGIDFRTVEGTVLPFANGSFDAVVSFQVIEHVEDIDSYLSEIARVLKPGGQAIFTTPNKKIRLDPGMSPWNAFHVQEFTDQELRQLLVTYFSVVRVRGQFAVNELYCLERARCANSRALARENLGSKIRKRLRSWLPDSVRARLKSLRYKHELGHTIDGIYSDADRKGYSTSDFFYRDTGLDEALSLFAIARSPRSY